MFRNINVFFFLFLYQYAYWSRYLVYINDCFSSLVSPIGDINIVYSSLSSMMS